MDNLKGMLVFLRSLKQLYMVEHALFSVQLVGSVGGEGECLGISLDKGILVASRDLASGTLG